jgi:hypothetical protein
MGDVAKLADAWVWLGTPGEIYEDAIPDGTVNFFDYTVLGELYGSECP